MRKALDKISGKLCVIGQVRFSLLSSVSSSLITKIMVFRYVDFRFSALKEQTREPASSPLSPALEDTKRRWSSANKEASPHQTPELLAP